MQGQVRIQDFHLGGGGEAKVYTSAKPDVPYGRVLYRARSRALEALGVFYAILSYLSLILSILMQHRI